jgi:hypothetical protein
MCSAMPAKTHQQQQEASLGMQIALVVPTNKQGCDMI